MRLFFLTALTMTAFAANSVFNKVGVSLGQMDPLDFAMIRVWAGAAMLLALMFFRTSRAGGLTRNGNLTGASSLLVYVLGFSLAYATLDTGVGALILFGMVQITMFAAAVRAGEAIAGMRYAGCGVAFAGLCVLLWPVGGAAPDVMGAMLMVAAGIGWGVYTLSGQGAAAPIAQTTSNFMYAAAAMILLALIIGRPGGSTLGLAMALLSGAVTSALGYALWYQVLPLLATTTAAIAQLTVPIIAVAGGVVFLGEDVSLRFGVACLLVLGGVILALRRS